MNGNDIGWAVHQLHLGNKVCREGWNGRGMWLALQVPDEHSKMQRPYVYMSTVDSKLVPWVCSQSDLLALDWGNVAQPPAALTENDPSVPAQAPSADDIPVALPAAGTSTL